MEQMRPGKLLTHPNPDSSPGNEGKAVAIYEDPHEVIKIDVEENSVTAVTVRPHWTTHYNVLTLTRQMNSLLHEAANNPAR